MGAGQGGANHPLHGARQPGQGGSTDCVCTRFVEFNVEKTVSVATKVFCCCGRRWGGTCFTFAGLSRARAPNPYRCDISSLLRKRCHAAARLAGAPMDPISAVRLICPISAAISMAMDRHYPKIAKKMTQRISLRLLSPDDPQFTIRLIY
jgi:hypothetical protein